MDKKEEKIQRALGLFRKYEGYIRMNGYTHHAIYERNATTIRQAHDQFNGIVHRLNKRADVHASLHMIIDKDTGKVTWLAGSQD